MKKLLIILFVSCITLCSCSSGDIEDDGQGENLECSQGKTENSSDAYIDSDNDMDNIINKGIMAENNLGYIISSGDGIYQINKNLFTSNLISSDIAYSINVYGEDVYYSNGSSGNGEIYKIAFDGSDKQQINSDLSYDLIICNDYIYYWTTKNIGDSIEYFIKRMSLDGTENILLVSKVVKKVDAKHIQSFYLYDHWIYYKNP